MIQPSLDCVCLLKGTEITFEEKINTHVLTAALFTTAKLGTHEDVQTQRNA